MKFSNYLENDFYYHGSSILFPDFNYQFLSTGKGYDQEGPGFYFTSDILDAKRYGNYLYKVKLHLKKVVPLHGKTKRTEIIKMIKLAPDLQDSLMDWNEDPKIAFENAVNAMSTLTPHEDFQSVWFDFYRGEEKQYLENMVNVLGYTGVIVPRNEIKHAIIFDRKAIEIIEIDKY